MGGKTITADKVFIVTGCRARIPDVPGLAGTPYITYKEALRLNTTPKSMIVFGGGYIACELGYYFSKTGTKVDFIVRNRMLTGEDPEVQAEFEKVFAEKQNVHFKTKPTKVSYDGRDFTVTLATPDGEKVMKSEALFVASLYY